MPETASHRSGLACVLLGCRMCTSPLTPGMRAAWLPTLHLTHSSLACRCSAAECASYQCVLTCVQLEAYKQHKSAAEAAARKSRALALQRLNSRNSQLAAGGGGFPGFPTVGSGGSKAAQSGSDSGPSTPDAAEEGVKCCGAARHASPRRINTTTNVFGRIAVSWCDACMVGAQANTTRRCAGAARAS
jgi:hypothetical protein